MRVCGGWNEAECSSWWVAVGLKKTLVWSLVWSGRVNLNTVVSRKSMVHGWGVRVIVTPGMILLR